MSSPTITFGLDDKGYNIVANHSGPVNVTIYNAGPIVGVVEFKVPGDDDKDRKKANIAVGRFLVFGGVTELNTSSDWSGLAWVS